MADFYKVSYHMQQFNLGWRYQFYLQKDSSRQAALTARDNMNKLMALHNKSVLLDSITAANVDTKKRDHYKISKVGAVQVNTGAAFTAEADVTQTTALISLRTEGTRERKIWLRGLSDTLIERRANGAPKLAARFRTKLLSWINDLPQVGWLMQYIEPPDPGSLYEWKDVTSIAAEPGSNNAMTVVTCRADHGFTLGQQVTFTASKKDVLLLGYRGTHTPVAVSSQGDNSKFVIPVTYRPTVDPYLPHRFRVRRVAYGYVGLDGNWDLINLRSRDTGRAPGPRGRETGVSFR